MKSNKGSGSTNAGASKALAGNAKRPPKLRGRVANDAYPDKVRSAVMPPPTTDTNFRRGRRGC